MGSKIPTLKSTFDKDGRQGCFGSEQRLLSFVEFGLGHVEFEAMVGNKMKLPVWLQPYRISVQAPRLD